MKKIIFVFALGFVMMSFSSIKDNKKEIFFEENTTEEFSECRWRFCHYKKGKKFCTEWEYGICFPEFVLVLEN